jgi:phosphatidylethanolamine-binding protein (PEBP) family uncharacterized protein
LRSREAASRRTHHADASSQKRQSRVYCPAWNNRLTKSAPCVRSVSKTGDFDMKKISISASVFSAAILVSGAAQAFSVKAEWGSGSGCSSVSPAFTMSRVPHGTTKLSFKMVDLNLPSFPHGGGETAFSGKTTFGQGEAFGGMFSSYRGPCPPPTATHRYEWTVQALDAGGKVLGTAKTVIPFKR